MAIEAHLYPESGQRASLRRSLLLATSGRLGDGVAANVTVHNLSAAGLLIETALELAVGEQLTIDLPEAGAVDAVIVWRSQQLYGCAFEQALGQAALAAAQLASTPPGQANSPLSGARPDAPGVTGATLGPKLNRLRRERGLTLADVAAALGVSKPTVWAWEKGKARPVPERLDAIAAVFGVSAEDLHEAGSAHAASHALIDECRQRLAAAFQCAPGMVRIMIEL